MTDGERRVLNSLDWLERDADLPDSIRSYFSGGLETAACVVLPAEQHEPSRGCADVSLYRAAFDMHSARRRALSDEADGIL